MKTNVNPFVVDRKPRVYAGTFNGMFEFKVAPNTPGAQQRTNKNGKVVWFTTAKSITGRIIDVDKRETEFGANLEIVFEKDGMELVFATPWKGNVAAGFLNRMENIDYTKPVQFDIASNGERQSLFIKQGVDAHGRGGTNVASLYTKENPNGRPDWRKIETGEGVFYDRSEQLKFFEDILENNIRPRLRGSIDNAPSTNATAALLDVKDDDFIITAPEETASMFTGAGNTPAGDDDLPF